MKWEPIKPGWCFANELLYMRQEKNHTVHKLRRVSVYSFTVRSILSACQVTSYFPNWSSRYGWIHAKQTFYIYVLIPIANLGSWFYVNIFWTCSTCRVWCNIGILIQTKKRPGQNISEMIQLVGCSCSILMRSKW